MWREMSIRGSLVYPVHEKSLFPRVVSSLELSARFSQLIADNGDEDMYVYEPDSPRYTPSSDAEAPDPATSLPTPDAPVASSSSQPAGPAAATKCPPPELWEHCVSPATDWDVSHRSLHCINGLN